MRLNSLKKALAVLLFLALSFKTHAAQIPIPFQGEVNADGINIRSDATASSGIICTANKGLRLDVVSELYGWYKVRLPKSAFVYIKKGLVECTNYKADKLCQNAKVLKTRVNVRLGPSESSPILGRADKNELINIVKEEGVWYKIEPIQNSFGWIHKRFVNPVILKK